MPTGLLLGLLASLGWGALDIAVARSTPTVGTLRVLVGVQLVSLGSLAVIALAAPAWLGSSPADGMLAGIPMGILAAVAYLTYFTALHLGPLSIVSPVVVAYGGATVALAVVLRGEVLGGPQVLGVLLVTAGVALAGLVIDGETGGRPRLAGFGVAAAVVALVGFAVLTLGLADPIRDHGWLPVLVGSRLGNCVAAVLLLVVALATRARSLRPMVEPALPWTRPIVAYVVLGGVFDVVAFTAYAVGLSIAPVWLIGLSSSLGPILAIAYAIGWLGERPRRNQWLGLGLIALGMLGLALTG